MGDKVAWVAPGMITPMTDAGELTVVGRNLAKITLANGYGSYGETVRCVRNKSGRITELIGATRILPAASVAREMEKRYGKKPGRKRRRR
jgi:hypothetical protein